MIDANFYINKKFQCLLLYKEIPRIQYIFCFDNPSISTVNVLQLKCRSHIELWRRTRPFTAPYLHNFVEELLWLSRFIVVSTKSISGCWNGRKLIYSLNWNYFVVSIKVTCTRHIMIKETLFFIIILKLKMLTVKMYLLMAITISCY